MVSEEHMKKIIEIDSKMQSIEPCISETYKLLKEISLLNTGITDAIEDELRSCFADDFILKVVPISMNQVYADEASKIGLKDIKFVPADITNGWSEEVEYWVDFIYSNIDEILEDWKRAHSIITLLIPLCEKHAELNKYYKKIELLEENLSEDISKIYTAFPKWKRLHNIIEKD